MPGPQIKTEDNKAFSLVTSNGQAVEVFTAENYTTVYAGKGLGIGRVFHGDNTAEQLLLAIDSYKNRYIKAALRALLSHLL